MTRGIKLEICVLGANSVLTLNVDNNQASSGNPCKIIGNVEMDHKFSIKKQ